MIINGLVHTLSIFFVGLAYKFNVDVSQVDFSFLDTLSTIFSYVCYFIPMKRLMPILLIIGALMTYRIFVSVVQTIWKLLPFA